MSSDNKVQCIPAFKNLCVRLVNGSPENAAGYHCIDRECYKCPVGTYGTDGLVCEQCPFATWSPNLGQTNCSASFTYSSVGRQSVYVPFGVNQISVSLWGGAGGGDKSSDQSDVVAHAGGGGGFLSCNVSVPSSSKIYVLVGGGGGASNYSLNNGGDSKSDLCRSDIIIKGSTSRVGVIFHVAILLQRQVEDRDLMLSSIHNQ